MKKHTRIILIPFTLLILLTVSCEKILDMKPQQSISSDEALSTPEGIQNLLIGAYEGIKGTNNGTMYGGTFNTFGELLAFNEDASGEGNFLGTFSTLQDLQAKALTASDADVYSTWIQAYYVINILNQVLDHLDLFTDDATKAIVQGQALGLRGMTYFEMARLWGLQYEPGVNNTQPAVPIVLKATYQVSDAVNVARNTVEEVYTQAEQDLLQAESLLKPFGLNDNMFSTYVASAMLSRLYLQKGEYEKAAQEADSVIEANAFSLASTPLQAYNKDGYFSEHIFSIRQTATSNAGQSNSGIATFYASLNGSGRGDIEILQNHLDLYEPGDLRSGVDDVLKPDGSVNDLATIKDIKKMFYIGIGSNAGKFNTSKWGDPRLYIPVIRLAEMYLTRAEGNFESGAPQVGPNTWLDDINVIRQRAGLGDLVSVDEATDRAAIRKERHLELCWEGFTLHDLRRWHEDVGGLPYNSPRLVLPIPQQERDVNHLLSQNPGY